MRQVGDQSGFVVRVFGADALLPHLKLEEVEGYCRNCDQYGNSWSCPPHAFDPEAWFSKHSHVVLIARVLPVDVGWTEAVAMEQYFAMTRCLNAATRSLEAVQQGATCLYAGRCDLCEPCARTLGKACQAPELCRFSLESLGFKVADVMAELLELPLQWSAGKLPDRFIAVSALLTQQACDEAVLRAALEREWSSDRDIEDDDKTQ